jgi:VanZ family protein
MMNTHALDPVGLGGSSPANTHMHLDYDRAVTRRLRLVLLAAAAYGIALVLIASWPRHVDRDVDVLDNPPGSWLISAGVAPDQAYRLIEGGANVLLFVPFGVLLMLAPWGLTWLRAAAAGLVISGIIEIVQGIALPGRTSNIGDVVMNTVGAAIGALGVAAWRRSARRRAERRHEA